jgi:hypothetical protein
MSLALYKVLEFYFRVIKPWTLNREQAEKSKHPISPKREIQSRQKNIPLCQEQIKDLLLIGAQLRNL